MRIYEIHDTIVRHKEQLEVYSLTLLANGEASYQRGYRAGLISRSGDVIAVRDKSTEEVASIIGTWVEQSKQKQGWPEDPRKTAIESHWDVDMFIDVCEELARQHRLLRLVTQRQDVHEIDYDNPRETLMRTFYTMVAIATRPADA